MDELVDTAKQPEVNYKGDGLYTIVMVDPDAPASWNTTERCW